MQKMKKISNSNENTACKKTRTIAIQVTLVLTSVNNLRLASYSTTADKIPEKLLQMKAGQLSDDQAALHDLRTRHCRKCSASEVYGGQEGKLLEPSGEIVQACAFQKDGGIDAVEVM
jgi:hypothetical protein